MKYEVIDEKEKKIISSLDFNARNSLTQIAKELKFSKDSTIYRVKKLEDKDIISKYYTVLDYSVFGFTNYRLYIKFNKIDKKLIDEVVEFLKEIKTVSFLTTVFDDYDIIITFNEKSINDFKINYKKILFKFARYISRKEFSIITSLHHFKFPLVLSMNSKFKCVTGKSTKIIEINEIEKKLINELSLDAKKSLVDMSSRINKSSSVLLYNLKSLEKKEIVLGYRPRINYNKLGYSHYIVTLYLNKIDEAKFESLIVFINSLNGVIYMSEAIGSYDLELEFICENHIELMKKLELLKGKYSDYILNIKSRVILKDYLINYSPF